MARQGDTKIFLVPGGSADFLPPINNLPYKLPPPVQIDLPTTNEVFGVFNALCFCCFAADVPLTNVQKCSHNGFVNTYLMAAPSVPLLICNLCHHMLKKIEGFRLQIENNFRCLLLKGEPDARCIFVNDLNRKPTISIVSIKPVPTKVNAMRPVSQHDPLSTSTALPLVEPQENYVNDFQESVGVNIEMPVIKTEPEENPNLVQSVTESQSTQYFMELTPTNIKQENLPPMPPLTYQGLVTPRENLNQNSVKSNPLNHTRIDAPTTSAMFINPQKNDSTKTFLAKNTNSHIVGLETVLDSIHKPWHPQQKVISEKFDDKGRNIIKLPNSSNIGANKHEASNDKKAIDETYYGKIGMITLTEAELLKEREKERLEEPFTKHQHRCESCIESFQYVYSLERHNERFHNIKNNTDIKCPVCGRYYSSERSMEEHSKKHYIRYVCQVCNLRSKDISNLTKHFNKTHTDKEPIKLQFECEDCEFVTYFRPTFNHHRHNHHKLSICEICNKQLTGNLSYKYHMKHCHGDGKETKKKKLFKCDECPRSFTTFCLFTSHKKNIHNSEGAQTPLFCQPCNKFYKTRFIYNNHLKRSAAHSNEYLKYECDYCNKKFSAKQRLLLHILKDHLKNYSFKCDHCNKLFVDSRELKRHTQVVHEIKKEDRQKEVCDICGKGYASKSVLKKHMLVHTGERPHACDICGMTFAQVSTLYTHKKLKHKIPRKNELVNENVR